LAKGHKARLEAETAMALNISQDKASPPIHVQGLLLRFSERKGTWIYQGKMRQPGSDTKVYLGSSSDMKHVASKVASAKGQDVSAWCMRRTQEDSMERFILMARLFKEWVPRDLFWAIQMRSQVSMMMVNAPGIYVGFLMGRELTWRKAILKVWGQMCPSTRLQLMGLDSHEADLRATASQIMHTCFQSAFQEWAHRTSPAEWNDWKIHVDRNVLFHLSLTVWGLREGLLCKTTQENRWGYITRTESGMGWLMAHTLAGTKCTG